MKFDDILPKLGEFGRYQKYMYLLICVAAIPSAYFNLANSFLSASSDHYCKVYDNQTYEESSPLKNCTIPFDSDGLWDKCNRYDINVSSGISKDLCYPRTDTINCDVGWVYDTSTYERTVVHEYDLVCSRNWMSQLSKSIVPLGNLIGALFCGQISDVIGRKPTFFVSLITAIIVAFCAAVSQSYAFFLICQLIMGICSTGMFLVGYVIGVELVGVEYRTMCGIVIEIFFACGYMLLAIVAAAVNGDWRKIQFVAAIVCVVFIPYYWLINESVRWLLQKSKFDEAESILQKAAKINKVSLPDDMFADEREFAKLSPEEKEKQKENNTDEVQRTMIDLFKTPNLRVRTINMSYQWFAVSFVYYGLSMNTDQLGVNPYVAFLLSGAVEIPAYLSVWWLLNKVGRRWTMFWYMVLGGVSLIISVPPEIAEVSAAWATIGKFFSAGGFAIAYVFAGEIYPTTVRNAGMGLSSTCARVGSIISPYVMLLIDVWYPLPYLIMAFASIIAGFLVLLLPETHNQEFPETLHEGEIFGTPAWDELKKEKEEKEGERPGIETNDIELQVNMDIEDSASADACSKVDTSDTNHIMSSDDKTGLDNGGFKQD
ncbi:organic cation transporter protein-like [Ptychodera flava]|uniref:organic cation transporter protein-like n=1 Tax=Ptychodera flava TaxID=63121 RepID=UPI00396A884A